MALLAESLVEEWLNRSGFFTIRGIKHGVGEIDLLGIKHEADAPVIGRHVEVQVSFRPVRYIAQLTGAMAREYNKPRTTAKKRTPEQIEECARVWVAEKFRSKGKQQVRESLWPKVEWSYHLVHGKIKEKKELNIFQSEGVVCHQFSDLLVTLCGPDRTFSGSAGGDLAEIVRYYNSERAINRP
jgi:Holliday junction resolvase-like predicted endonuclease